MKIHVLKRQQILKTDIQTAWEFFSSPLNLNAITPPDLKFRFLSDASGQASEGQIIVYRIRILPLVFVTWVTEIRHVDPLRSFTDEQRFGPYKFWHHRHRFTDNGSSVAMEDEVHYAVGYGLIGELVHRFFIRQKLQAIFDYRQRILEEKFNRH